MFHSPDSKQGEKKALCRLDANNWQCSTSILSAPGVLLIQDAKTISVDFIRERKMIHYTPLRNNGALVESKRLQVPWGLYIRSKAPFVSFMTAEKVVEDLHSIEDICLDHNKAVCMHFSCCDLQFPNQVLIFWGSHTVWRYCIYAECIIRTALPQCRIFKDICHPNHELYQKLPSGQQL